MKRKVRRLNWQGSADQFEYGKILPGNNQSDFRINGLRHCISHGHITNIDIAICLRRVENDVTK